MAWISLLEAGVPIYHDDNWICFKKDRYPLGDGYKAARLVKCSDDSIYKMICSIDKSGLGVPIFTCSSYLYNMVDRTYCDKYSYTLSLKKSITLANAFLKRINGVTTKYWSGTNFFGIDLKHVQRIINEIHDSNERNRAAGHGCVDDSGGDIVISGYDGLSDSGGDGQCSKSGCPQSDVSVSEEIGMGVCSASGSGEICELEDVEYNLNYNWLGIACFGKKVDGEFELFYQHVQKTKE